MRDKMVSILSKISGFEPDDIVDDINLFEDEILDSFAVIQLLVEIEKEFGIPLNISEIERKDIDTVSKLVDLVNN